MEMPVVVWDSICVLWLMDLFACLFVFFKTLGAIISVSKLKIVVLYILTNILKFTS